MPGPTSTPLLSWAERRSSWLPRGRARWTVVRQLLAKGASVNAADGIGITPLIAAASVNDADVVNLLLAHGADATAASRGPVGTALQGAAANGNLSLVKTLLARSSNVDAVSVDSAGTVKNGSVQFGHVTALHLAVLSGNADVVRQILAAGAAVDALDIRGMTPLMFAIGTDRPDPRIVRMLLQGGASTTLRSKAGESAIDWARKFQDPEILAELKLPRTLALDARTIRRPQIVHTVAAHEPTARAAVERSLPILSAASGRMLTDGGCVACHAQPLTGVAVNLARAIGWTNASAEGDSTQALTTLTANAPGLLQFRDGGGLPDTLVYASFLLAAAGTPPGRATDVLVHYLAAKQRPEGNWKGTGATRAPMQDGNFSRTALSIRALTAYATPARAGEYKSRVERAATWLAAQAPVSTEDRVMQLLGLHWANADAAVRQKRMQQLRALQRVRRRMGTDAAPGKRRVRDRSGAVHTSPDWRVGRGSGASTRRRLPPADAAGGRVVAGEEPRDEDTAVLRERVPLRARPVDLARGDRLGNHGIDRYRARRGPGKDGRSAQTCG